MPMQQTATRLQDNPKASSQCPRESVKESSACSQEQTNNNCVDLVCMSWELLNPIKSWSNRLYKKKWNGSNERQYCQSLMEGLDGEYWLVAGGARKQTSSLIVDESFLMPTTTRSPTKPRAPLSEIQKRVMLEKRQQTSIAKQYHKRLLREQLEKGTQTNVSSIPSF